MKITDDVIRDLMPLYLEGEASADTRALVDAYLADHPALAEETRSTVSLRLPMDRSRAVGDAERVILGRTRRLLRWRFWCRFVAIFFTAIPFAFAFDGRGVQWFFWPAHVPEAVTSLLVGAAGWISVALVERKLKPGGF
jgi:anti-sigma factor RsiW